MNKFMKAAIVAVVLSAIPGLACKSSEAASSDTTTTTPMPTEGSGDMADAGTEAAPQ